MIAADPVLSTFAEAVARVIHERDSGRLRDYLSGRHLPALGGDAEPADSLYRALAQTADFPTVSRGLAELLARVISEEAEALQNSAVLPEAEQRIMLLNALYLAAELPTNAELFTALKALLVRLRALETEEGSEGLWLALWRSLAIQQVDDSLEQEWLALLRDSPDAPRSGTPARRTLMLEAWRGLLWIPPDGEHLRAGEVVNFERIERGLLALSGSVDGRAVESDMLGHAITILMETYPRSTQFWERRWIDLISRWPPKLTRDLSFQVLQGSAKNRSVSQDFRREERYLTKVFKALSDDTRQEILRLLEGQQRTVGEIVDNFNLSQPTISRHLSVLKEADLILEQHRGQTRVYRLKESLAPSNPSVTDRLLAGLLVRLGRSH